LAGKGGASEKDTRKASTGTFHLGLHRKNLKKKNLKQNWGRGGVETAGTGTRNLEKEPSNKKKNNT